jgi:CTP synthase
MVGKYNGLSDSYLSVLKVSMNITVILSFASKMLSLLSYSCVWKILQALLHASVDCRRKLVIEWVASTDLEDSTAIEVRHNPLQITTPYVQT